MRIEGNRGSAEADLAADQARAKAPKGPKTPPDLPEHARGNPGEAPRGDGKAASEIAALAGSVSQVLSTLAQLGASTSQAATGGTGTGEAPAGDPGSTAAAGGTTTAGGGGPAAQPAPAPSAPAPEPAAPAPSTPAPEPAAPAPSAPATQAPSDATGTATRSGSATGASTTTKSTLSALLANRPTFRTSFSGTLGHAVPAPSQVREAPSQNSALEAMQLFGGPAGAALLQEMLYAPDAATAQAGLQSVLGALGMTLLPQEQTAFNVVASLQDGSGGMPAWPPFGL